MALTGWCLVVQRALSVTFFQIFRLVFTAFQTIYWEYSGTASQLRQCTDPRYYRRSAHVLDIILHRDFCEALSNTFGDFLCVHNRFEDPQYVINNEHVTLMMLDEQHAYFGVARDKSK